MSKLAHRQLSNLPPAFALAAARIDLANVSPEINLQLDPALSVQDLKVSYAQALEEAQRCAAQ